MMQDIAIYKRNCLKKNRCDTKKLRDVKKISLEIQLLFFFCKTMSCVE